MAIGQKKKRANLVKIGARRQILASNEMLYFFIERGQRPGQLKFNSGFGIAPTDFIRSYFQLNHHIPRACLAGQRALEELMTGIDGTVDDGFHQIIDNEGHFRFLLSGSLRSLDLF